MTSELVERCKNLGPLVVVDKVGNVTALLNDLEQLFDMVTQLRQAVLELQDAQCKGGRKCSKS